ncbi:hypothetical protein [Cytobacillus massiliigabonensis]|uniref:hypothetical protein n=1 Tax=Cytobacillus massiliigabonensis TaxID=1871011 RepID=UPI000C828F71|nr:hypothetical protein [Cytobacillus massiliigabonensis]
MKAQPKVHVIKDESLGGIEREYVGEYEELKMVGERHLRKVFGLAPTEIVHIDGARYRMVERKAEVGERVIAIEEDGYEIGDLLTVKKADRWGDGDGISISEHTHAMYHSEYRVLEPVVDELIGVDTTQASPQVLDLLANLARRVTSLEQQLKDTQANVERQAEDLASTGKCVDDGVKRLDALESDSQEQAELIEMCIDDIVTLDERTNESSAIHALQTTIQVLCETIAKEVR